MVRISWRSYLMGLLISLVLLIPSAIAQKPGSPQGNSGSGGSSSQSSSAGGGSLPGISYTQGSWRGLTNLPPTKRKKVLCYKLRHGNSSIQPFILEPLPKNKLWNSCTLVDSEHPLLMREVLVIGIDESEILDDSRLKLININLTNQQGNPINPTPIRPSFTGGAATTSNAALGVPIYLTWPYQLPGDAIPTVSVNTIYTAPPPGTQWRPNTFYPAGSVVTSPYNNGHFYTAIRGGVSGPSDQPEPTLLSAAPPTIIDHDLTWIDSGNSLPGTGKGASVWLPMHPYCQGDVIADPYNGHFYTVIVGGQSANPTAPCATTSGPAPTDPFPLTPPAVLPGQAQFQVNDGSVLWQFVGKPLTRRPSTSFSVGHAVKDVASNHHYAVVQSVGNTGPSDDNPFLAMPAPANRIIDGGVTWQLVTPWTQNHPYSKNDFVVDQAGSHLYQSVGENGISGLPPSQPFFPIIQMSTVTEKPVPARVTETYLSGSNVVTGITWEDAQVTGDNTTPPWTPNTPYHAGDRVRNPTNNEVYRALNDGNSGPGPNPPGFSLTPNLQIEWQDSGTTPPASVASGQPSDVNVNLLNVTLPQVHSVYYYNLASGVVVSTVRVPNNVAIQVPVTSGSPQFSFQQKGSNLLVDPILLFTAYIRPMDAERPFRPKEIFHLPGVSFGLSLSSPSSNFYVGGSTEVLRNVQLVYGFSVARISKLAVPSGTTVTASGGGAPTPPTVQHFEKGGFIGLTYNISGFIQGLFGGGGGKSSQ